MQFTQGIRSQTIGLIQLTRWQEHIGFVVPLSLVGALLAIANAPDGTLLDWRLIVVTVANFLAVAFAFMINDIEDAPDDARDPARAIRNPVASGRVQTWVAYSASATVALASLILYLLCGWWVFVIGVLTVALSHMYSWKPVRLKAYPVTDILSHALMLAGLLFLAAYFVYDITPGAVWWVAIGVTTVSAYGQLYNQLRDYDMDKAAGLHNTAIVLGERGARLLSYVMLALTVVFFAIAILSGVFPIWLAGVVAVSIVVSLLYKPTGDMRGGESSDMTGRLQVQGLIVVSLTMIVWLAVVLLQQWQLL